jgi:hypothetical protein
MSASANELPMESALRWRACAALVGHACFHGCACRRHGFDRAVQSNLFVLSPSDDVLGLEKWKLRVRCGSIPLSIVHVSGAPLGAPPSLGIEGTCVVFARASLGRGR